MNYRDGRGLTPLYLCASNSASGTCMNLLLYNYAMVGVVDSAGCAELHQVTTSYLSHALPSCVLYSVVDISVINLLCHDDDDDDDET